MRVILMKGKSDAYGRFKMFKQLVEKVFKKEITNLIIDRGREFTSREFNDF